MDDIPIYLIKLMVSFLHGLLNIQNLKIFSRVPSYN